MHQLGAPSCLRGQFEPLLADEIVVDCSPDVAASLTAPTPTVLSSLLQLSTIHGQRFSPEQMLAYLQNFSKASAPGPSGWRMQHILELATNPASTGCAEALQALATFVGLALSWFLTNNLTSQFPLRKTNGGIHPIAVGELSAS